MALYDVDELLAKMKVRGMIPVGSGSWSDANLIDAMSDAADNFLAPLLIAARGEYLVKTQDIPFVAAQRSYRPNSRVAAIRHIAVVRADGTEYPLEGIGPPAKSEAGMQPARAGQPAYFTFEDGVITLWPVPGAVGDSLRVRYHYQLNRMVAVSSTTTISAITPATPSALQTRLTVVSIPAAMNAATKVDLIRAVPNYDLLGFDAVPQSAIVTAGTTIDLLTTAIPTDLAVGDRVALARYTPFPNMPRELHLCAALRAASSVVASKGDQALGGSLLAESVAIEKALLHGILAPRTKGNPISLVNRRFR